jgi:hypothetical protein
MDGFYISYAKFSGQLRSFDILDAHRLKESGRPFVGLVWHLATLLTGGTVDGYNSCLLALHALNATIVYALGRTLLPQFPLVAVTAAALKLVWSANYELFDNSGLAIYFAEALFLFACWILVLLSRDSHSRFETALGRISLVVSLLVVIGTYQVAWPLILLFPATLLLTGVIHLQESRSLVLLTLWYSTALPMMGWCFYLASGALSVSPPLLQVAGRAAAGAWHATFEALTSPFLGRNRLFSIRQLPYWLIGASLTFSGLWVWAAWGSWGSLASIPRTCLTRSITKIVLIGFVIVFAAVLPPSVLYTPTYSSRFMEWASFGTILVIVAFSILLLRVHPWIGGLAAAAANIALVSAMMVQVYSISKYYTLPNFANRRFWQDVSTLLPRLDEGTVVLMDGPPTGVVALADVFSTWVLRAMSDTHTTFFITDSKPVWDAQLQAYQITTVVDLARKEPLVPGSQYFRAPALLPEPRTYTVTPDRIVWADWNWPSLRLRIVPERSAMQRVHQDIPSTFGQSLFPAETISHDRMLPGPGAR